MSHLRPAVILLLLFTVLTGIAYPLAITGIAQVAFPEQANGSLVRRNGAVVGSTLIGQWFAAERYMQPRPSATTAPDPADPDKTIDSPYNAASSTGSNLGPTSTKLAERLAADITRLRQAGIDGPIPGDAATTSGSGLDPDVSLAYALLQVPRIARSRGIPEDAVRRTVEAQAAGRALGLFGEPRVNVLAVNLALDELRS
jgi:K+-transporting ATPase ATPase C chain